MEAFTLVRGLIAPLPYANVDTDAIIPKQFLKSIKRTGFGPNLFDSWRYLDEGSPDKDCHNRPINSDFVLNQPQYKDAKILLAQKNFGCGSSREHAVWALVDYGFRAVIAPSFAEIFYNNAFKNGLLPIILNEGDINKLFQLTEMQPHCDLTIDLPAQEVILPTGEALFFEVDEFRKHCLSKGLDDIGLTLQYVNEIRAYEAQKKLETPWLFQKLG
ncbi:3-isopropylmalate dehydratase small subunit [Candidatus Nitrosacidococcus tergens]|uniref:3-isopropylmalate dehydratase small subunit n=1 Tax=Candidatus Nitrosacidococcus tergens TaxID=553981 RepID=A0A7G1QA33_9GAMM|nr:3-isopropylmalate dehydratase small subunit [Candidatus Nitrosacidococcus tergens]CAB1276261.1 3-isopropylmalate dehydratase, small subunit [Candidatus Nitrosacidococcus tergens]